MYSDVRIRYEACGSPANHRPLPAGKSLSLTIDDVPSDGADDTCRLILALAPADSRSDVLCTGNCKAIFLYVHKLKKLSVSLSMISGFDMSYSALGSVYTSNSLIY